MRFHPLIVSKKQMKKTKPKRRYDNERKERRETAAAFTYAVSPALICTYNLFLGQSPE
jgi:hypothetical protein